MFLTIEGIDGSGKSTQIGLLTQYLKKNKIDFIQTREPGGSFESEKLRDIILDKKNNFDIYSELLIFFAARNENIKKTILPALKNNKLVICDRFIDSTIAYQGYGRNIEITKIEILKNFIYFLEPDLTIYYDIEPNISYSRLENLDRFEKEGLDFQKKVRNGFLEIAKKNKRIHIIDTSNYNKEIVHNKTIDILENYLKGMS